MEETVEFSLLCLHLKWVEVAKGTRNSLIEKLKEKPSKTLSVRCYIYKPGHRHPQMGPEGPCQQELLEKVFVKRGWGVPLGTSAGCRMYKVRVLVVFWELEIPLKGTTKVQSAHFLASIVSKMLFTGPSNFLHWETLKILKLEISFLRRNFPKWLLSDYYCLSISNYQKEKHRGQKFFCLDD